MKSAEFCDDELIAGCRANSRRCQEALYCRYARSLYNLCLIYENDRDKARDILQDGFVKIFRNIDSFNRKCSLNCWMKKIIINTAIDHFRKNNGESEYIPLEDITPPFSDEESIASILNTKDIISQVNRLPAGARMIFKLHVIEGYSHKEVASLLHISEGTSKSQVNRAKHLLQHWIGG